MLRLNLADPSAPSPLFLMSEDDVLLIEDVEGNTRYSLGMEGGKLVLKEEE